MKDAATTGVLVMFLWGSVSMNDIKCHEFALNLSQKISTKKIHDRITQAEAQVRPRWLFKFELQEIEHAYWLLNHVN